MGILEVVTPGGIERYFEQIAPVLTQRGPDWTKRLYALAKSSGTAAVEALTGWYPSGVETTAVYFGDLDLAR